VFPERAIRAASITSRPAEFAFLLIFAVFMHLVGTDRAASIR
jgi:hypothetical protein